MCVKTHLRGNLFCPIDLVEIKKSIRISINCAPKEYRQWRQLIPLGIPNSGSSFFPFGMARTKQTAHKATGIQSTDGHEQQVSVDGLITCRPSVGTETVSVTSVISLDSWNSEFIINTNRFLTNILRRNFSK